MLIPHKGHTDTIQVYSVTVMTHVKALQAGHSSQGTSEPITPVLGEVADTLCAAGQRTSGGADVGVFPRRAIPRARAPERKWVLSPGESYPRREGLLGRTIYVYWIDVIYLRLKCQLSGDVLHL